MPKPPSPCIGVCKFRRDAHCIGCSMTREQKALSKQAKKPEARRAFVTLVMAQQAVMGGYRHWDAAYAKACAKKGVEVPPRPDAA
ncbi:DUF1289 domain-containing protein [Limimaricola hongkongensis]|uniref:DUF1289 domain-containing protein n=1 Tax=Limimaricola hongkongensis DSM 17492 TaxID=1122180 RepID=A0A017HAD4_9RHOB|nr:DUF1289 domain-containing protein [Limimaricola hongkongensis]EYD70749.1 hypothetical protein Lokhon_02391 [Limimaricola hongkongensis DSM 17492]